MKRNVICCLSAAAVVLLVSACQDVRNPSGDEHGVVAGTGTESQDMTTVADKMVRQILNTPEIANAKGVPRVALLPVNNETDFPINKDLFIDRIVSLLNQRAAGRVQFMADTGRAADFVLAGTFTSARTRKPSDYLVYSFKLIDPHNSDIVCPKKEHEIKKRSLETAAHR